MNGTSICTCGEDVSKLSEMETIMHMMARIVTPNVKRARLYFRLIIINFSLRIVERVHLKQPAQRDMRGACPRVRNLPRRLIIICILCLMKF